MEDEEEDDEQDEEELDEEEARFYGEADEEESPRPPALLPDDASVEREPGSPSPAIESDGARAVSMRHPGPMAGGFHAPFDPDSSDDPIIGTIDPDGLALVAIQGLNEIVQQKDEEIEDLRGRVERLEALARAALVG